MAGPPTTPSSYIANITGSSLTSFYDNVVYWEIAKNTNRFFVTFEKGLHGIPNNQIESIATNEITYPHVNSNTASLDLFASGATRNAAGPDAFLEEEEKFDGSGHQYDGYISNTELKGTRFFQSTITSSQFIPKTFDYQISGSNGLVTATRTISASYFYPFSNYQLSVLRKSPTLIIDLDKNNELPNDVGDKGFVLIPEHTHPDIKANLDFYLKKANI